MRIRELDPDDDADLIDEVSCPKCGAGHVTILKMPQLGSWFNAEGRGRCEHCRAEFSIKLIGDDGKPQDVNEIMREAERRRARGGPPA